MVLNALVFLFSFTPFLSWDLKFSIQRPFLFFSSAEIVILKISSYISRCEAWIGWYFGKDPFRSAKPFSVTSNCLSLSCSKLTSHFMVLFNLNVFSWSIVLHCSLSCMALFCQPDFKRWFWSWESKWILSFFFFLLHGLFCAFIVFSFGVLFWFQCVHICKLEALSGVCLIMVWWALTNMWGWWQRDEVLA